MIKLRTKAVEVTGVQYAYDNIETIKKFTNAYSVKIVEQSQLEIQWDKDCNEEYIELRDWIVKLDDTYEIIPANVFDKWFERIN